MIDPAKYYGLKQLWREHPLLQRKSYAWLWTLATQGKLRTIDTSTGSQRKRFLVKGSDALKFIENLTRESGKTIIK